MCFSPWGRGSRTDEPGGGLVEATKVDGRHPSRRPGLHFMSATAVSNSCPQVLEMDPDNTKALFRRAMVGGRASHTH